MVNFSKFMFKQFFLSLLIVGLLLGCFKKVQGAALLTDDEMESVSAKTGVTFAFSNVVIVHQENGISFKHDNDGQQTLAGAVRIDGMIKTTTILDNTALTVDVVTNTDGLLPIDSGETAVSVDLPFVQQIVETDPVQLSLSKNGQYQETPTQVFGSFAVDGLSLSVSQSENAKIYISQ